ncbi:MAG TPA: CDP-alcohol phosphatidyltransferase family protein [Polyangiaceae bacterium]|jgi:cardiolipin synthase|nr:CDP-alcohol phosphatidyltransferase family protein [Polyangiaceae bacterium]
MQYRARDLFVLPGLLSLSRIPLAACFALLVDRPAAAALVLFVAGLTDVLDGWTARRYGLVTATGMVLDPVTDKLFVLTVAVALVVRGHLSLSDVLLLSTREIGELPLVAWLALSRAARSARAEQPSANAPGKLVTVLQFIAVCWAIFRWSGLACWLAAAAITGVLAAVSYWMRSLRTLRYHAS